MIRTLSVENLAIIESVKIELGEGFTVFSGETGAGKSLLVDAMQLALGGRADSLQVRTGNERAVIQMVIHSSDEESGNPPQQIEREIYREGRSVAKVDGKVMPVASLREIGKSLVDLHGQHDHQQLLNQETHGETLDAWLGEAALSLKLDLGEKWDQYTIQARRLDSLRKGRREWERQVDSLRYQIEEIEEICPAVGEFEQLEIQISKLKNAEGLARAVSDALALLADNEENATDMAASAAKSLGSALKMDGSLAGLADTLNDSVILMQDAAHDLRAYLDGIDASPQLLDECQARLDGLIKLRRKYGEDEHEVLTHLARCQQELQELTEFSGDEESLSADVDAKEEIALEAARKLSDLRRSSASRFEDAVLKSLRELVMENAAFEVVQVPSELSRNGIDRIEFYFSANAGEPAKPLAKIASGGEMSRVMLALKTALAGRAGVPTLVFDEVDAGLSGQAAAAMARLLRQLGNHYQVLVISHLPQICAQAGSHFKIEKVVRGGRTVTVVKEVVGSAREEEIARLVAGEEITTASLAHARELLGTSSKPQSA